jgi:hypothetical protein
VNGAKDAGGVHRGAAAFGDILVSAQCPHVFWRVAVSRSEDASRDFDAFLACINGSSR